MHPSRIIIAGLVLLSLGIGPIILEVNDGHSPILTEPPDCTDTLDRQVVGSVDDPDVIGNVTRYESNRSLVNITYDVKELDSSESIHITLPENSSLISFSRPLRKNGDSELSGPLTKSQFWVVFEPGSAWGTTYPSDEEWLIAPIPDHNSYVALKPGNEGYIGRNTMWLGENEIVTLNSSCQTFRVVQPSSANFDTERKLKTLDSATRVLDIGHRYSTIRIFAVPNLEDLGGFVEGYDNEIVLEGTASVYSADNVWIHEYVHTTQFKQYGGKLSWLNEGAAEYYAARTSLELDLISDIEFDSWLSRQQGYDPEIPLAKATHEDVAYNWGSVVLAETAARAYSTKSRTSFMETYDDLDQYGVRGYDDFESALERLELGDSYVNSTRQSVMSKDRPTVTNAYQSHYGQYAGIIKFLSKFSIGLGGTIIVIGLWQTWSKNS